MDTKIRSEGFRAPCLFKSVSKPLKWRLRKLQHLSSDEQARKLFRTNAVKSSIRKYIRRQQKKQMAKLQNDELLIENNELVGRNSTKENHERVAELEQPRPQGAMAPVNTTQYLMDLVYDDLAKTSNMSCPHAVSYDMSEFNHASLLPRSEYFSLDSECSLVFQQRDFDEIFRHFGSH